MSKQGEITLIQHLIDRDSLEVMARHGLNPEIIPTESLREVVVWAIDYFHHSGRTKAPSEGALRADFGDLLDDLEIVLDEPSDSVEWALDDLSASFVHSQAVKFQKDMALAMSEAHGAEKVEVLNDMATRLLRLSLSVESHERRVDIREVMEERILAYEARAANPDAIYGMRFGLPSIDAYTCGIHPGELAILAGGAKVGKSYAVDRFALMEWLAGRTVGLYTLENSVEMTLDRLACMATGISAEAWQMGTCTEGEVQLVRDWQVDISHGKHPLYVISPPIGQRSVEHIVRDAQVHEVQSLLIDQLTFIELPADSRKPKHERIGDALHILKSMISSTRDPMPCVLAHQINREGMAAARKVSHYEMSHLAESSECERTADWVFGLYQSEEQEAAGEALFQTLAVRRKRKKHFTLAWHIDTGHVAVRGETKLKEG